jgi:O-antigen/teichoic acid export membrane protein
LQPSLEESNPELTQADHRANRKASVLKTIKTSIWTKFPSVIILLVVLPLATREFGPTFNAFAAILALLSTFQTFNLGVGPAAAMELSKFAESPNEELEKRVIGQAFVAYLSSSVATALIFAITYFALGQNKIYGESIQDQDAILQSGTILIGLGILLNGPTAFCLQLYTGYLQEHKNAQANILVQTISLLGTLLAVTVFNSPLMFLAAQTFPHPIINILHSIRFFRNVRPKLQPVFDNKTLNGAFSFFKKNLLFSIGTMGALATRSFPIILIGFYNPNADQIGTANIFINWLNPLVNLMTLFTISLSPAIATAITNNDSDWVRRILNKLAKGASVALLFAVPLAFVLGPMINDVLFPERYALTNIQFALLAIAAMTSASLGLAFSTSAAQRAYRRNASAGLIQAFVGIAVAVAAIPSLGITGLALAIISSEITAIVFLTKSIRTKLGSPKATANPGHL